MNAEKKRTIQQLVDSNIQSFSQGLYGRYEREIEDPKGVINSKKNNVFYSELGADFIFYSAFVRSFDSSLGGVLEVLGNAIANISFETMPEIKSYLYPSQISKIQELRNAYSTDAKHRSKPDISHYNQFTCITPVDKRSFEVTHKTDHCFYDRAANKYYIMELKAGGDLDNKKAVAEKEELLKEYFMLKNIAADNAEIRLFFATAYNKFGEGNEWKQHTVKACFAEDELLIGKDYWNFVCNDEQGFDIVIEQYRQSSIHIKNALERIKSMYL